MNVLSEIDALKSEILQNIEKSLKKNDSARIVASSKLLEELENMYSRYQNLEKQIVTFKKLFNSTDIDAKHTIIPKSIEAESQVKKPSAKAKGEIRRRKFIEQAQENGINLIHLKGVKYKSNKHNLIGIASASEKSPDFWFLGLPGLPMTGKFDTVVLLCENKSGEIFTFIPPKEFLLKYFDKFSRDSNDQIKFNIRLKHNKFYMIIPGLENQEIDSMLDSYENL